MQPTAASAMTISGAEVNAQPFSRPGEALEVVPGLIVTQHSGEGKANQYFLRGFNLDHGTDLAIKIDGMPVNMPTHGHGQGYADINFMIPELIQSVNVRKGPYFADVGDFGSAGSLAIDYINRLPKNISGDHQRRHSAITEGWRRDRRRSVRARCSRRSRASNTTAHGTWRTMCARLNGVLRYSQGTATDGFTLVGDGLFQRLEFDRPGGAARDRPEHHRPFRDARSDRWRHVEPLLAVGQLGAFERVRADQGQCL